MNAVFTESVLLQKGDYFTIESINNKKTDQHNKNINRSW